MDWIPLLITGPLSGAMIQGLTRRWETSQALASVQKYNNGSKVPYHPLWGYNSNSFTYTLLYFLGYGNTFRPLNWTPDWGKLVPGLY